MKQFGLIIALGFMTQLSLAETTPASVTIGFSNISLTSQESAAAIVDLQQEIRKQSPTTSLKGARLRNVEVTGHSPVLGATIALLIADVPLDSQTIESVQSKSVLLKAADEIVEGSWLLGIRGQLNLEKVTLHFDYDPKLEMAAPAPIPVTKQPVVLQSGPAIQIYAPTPVIEKDPIQFVSEEAIFFQTPDSERIEEGFFGNDADPAATLVFYVERDSVNVPRQKVFKSSGCFGDVCVGRKHRFRGKVVTVRGFNSSAVLIQKSSAGTLERHDLRSFMEEARPEFVELPEVGPIPQARPNRDAQETSPKVVKRVQPTVVTPQRQKLRSNSFAEFDPANGRCYERRRGSGEYLREISADYCRASQGTFHEFDPANGRCYERARGSGVYVQESPLEKCRKSQGTFAEFDPANGRCYERARGSGVYVQEVSLNVCRKSQGTFAQRDAANGRCYERARGSGVYVSELKSSRCR